MPYCYACRNDKPATHAHFVEHGILAMRPPKRHITEIEALWDSMTELQQARALEEGRQFLAHSETAGERAPRSGASASRSAGNGGAPRPRQQAQTHQEREEEGQEEGEGSPWGLIAVGALFLGGISWAIYQGMRGA